MPTEILWLSIDMFFCCYSLKENQAFLLRLLVRGRKARYRLTCSRGYTFGQRLSSSALPTVMVSAEKVMAMVIGTSLVASRVSL